MLSLGIDLGTSGVRAIVLDHHQKQLAEAHYSLPNNKQNSQTHEQVPSDWWTGFEAVLALIQQQLKTQSLSLKDVHYLAIDGTSATVLVIDKNGHPISKALMYNDQQAVKEALIIQKHAHKDSAVMGPTSGLAKLLFLFKQYPHAHRIIHQADWINGRLLKQYHFSDHNNALKMGYDTENKCWPTWVLQLLEAHSINLNCLPKVLKPGDHIATIDPIMAQHFGFHPKLMICAGTTDSTAAIIASGAHQIGEAVTSLGSTMVMKVISDRPIVNKEIGVYSQPYGDNWLVGGSSNSGGNVLKFYFSNNEINQLTNAINVKYKDKSLGFLGLDYYPLAIIGERFPINDPQFRGKLEPHINEPIDFFQALLEGMANIEQLAYQKLLDLGAPYPKLVQSIGGGAKNECWTRIRQEKLSISVIQSQHQQAATGAAMLAQKN